MTDTTAEPAPPWIAEPLRRTLASSQAHALLIHGPSGVGQFELALALAAAWLCESAGVPLLERPCGTCASCRLIAARSHPDLLVLVPDALREALGWNAATGEGEEGGEGSKKKASKEIRVEAVRTAIEFATTTSARGRGKYLVVHPAERMNPIVANAFLKTLEEPAGGARFLLCSAAPDRLLPTIRSRCQSVSMAVPPRDQAEAWLASRGVEAPAILLSASGGQPEEALALAARGVDAKAWLGLPAQLVRGDATTLQRWPLPLVVETLQKVCHDALSVACGAAPRYFPARSLTPGAQTAALLRWARDLGRLADEAEHPWSLDLTIDNLVEQSREALKTPRSPDREGKALSLNSGR
jgi:DNA polymerase-3 subunit delta'